ncbi:MAG: hypothetical protein K6F76_03980 [Clostridiales bacterium]|nr:hypothetical protein [Clostridiales bacterium]
MKRIKTQIIAVICIGVLVLSLAALLFFNYSDFLIAFNTEKPVIESDYSYIMFQGQKYVPYLESNGLYSMESAICYVALTKGQNYIDYWIFPDRVFKSEKYDNIIWLQSECDYGFANYSVFILDSV